MRRLKTNLRGFTLIKHSEVSSKGFTLIELLIVIVILGVLAGGVILAIDPADRIRYANDSKIQTIVGTVARASEAYAITKNGFYPADPTDLVNSGDLKAIPTGPPTEEYKASSTPSQAYAAIIPKPATTCTAGSSCTGVAIYGIQRSKKNGAGTSTSPPANNFTWFVYNSDTGKTCTSAAGAAAPNVNAAGTFTNIPAGCQ